MAAFPSIPAESEQIQLIQVSEEKALSKIERVATYVFGLIPRTWLNTPTQSWPEELPEQMATLEPEKFSTVEVQEGFRTLKKVFQACKPFGKKIEQIQLSDHTQIIRDNLERNPRLKLAPFVSDMHLLYSILFPKQSELDLEGLVAHTLFAQALTKYPLTEIPFKIPIEDRYALFLIQFGMVLYSEEEFPIFLQNFLPKSGDKNASSGQINLFLGKLEKFCRPDDLLVLLPIFRELFKRARSDARPPKRKKEVTQLLLQSGPIVYGFNFPFEDRDSFKRSCVFLDTLPRFSSHQTRSDMLAQAFKLNPDLAAFFDYGWWYTQHKRGKSMAPSERLGDWVMTELLLNETHKGIECEVSVQLVKNLFRNYYPHIPFNKPRAESVYYAYQIALRKKSTFPYLARNSTQTAPKSLDNSALNLDEDLSHSSSPDG